jgi:methyl-accepting chemotaxis protein
MYFIFEGKKYNVANEVYFMAQTNMEIVGGKLERLEAGEAEKLKPEDKLVFLERELERLRRENQEYRNYVEMCLSKLEEAIKSLSSGNLNVELQKIRDDEFGKTFEILNEFIGKLRRVILNLAEELKTTSKMVIDAREGIKQLQAGMEQINTASQQIATGSENLSKLANSALSDAKDLQKFLEKVNEAIISMTKAAANADKNAEASREQGSKAVSMLKEIVENIRVASEMVRNLEAATKNIGKVTERIKSIADQTNLLALNAAIEAARAGEHGRGFAVVADEVRKLAEESRKSTEEIAEIVANVQEGTRKVIDAINNAGKAGEVGKEGISLALKMAEEINVAVGQINKMAAEIEKGVAESMEKINNLARSFEEVASTAEENASASEETSAAMEEQTAAVGQINTAINRLNEFIQNTRKNFAESFNISLN